MAAGMRVTEQTLFVGNGRHHGSELYGGDRGYASKWQPREILSCSYLFVTQFVSHIQEYT